MHESVRTTKDYLLFACLLQKISMVYLVCYTGNVQKKSAFSIKRGISALPMFFCEKQER